MNRSIIIKRSAAIGDVLCSTFLIRKLSEMGFETKFQAMPEAHCILRRVSGLSGIGDTGGGCDVDLDGAYETDQNRWWKHFAQMYFERANHMLKDNGIQIESWNNFAPKLDLNCGECEDVLVKLAQHEKPWLIFCLRSEHNLNRCIPDSYCTEISRLVPGTKFWLSLQPAPEGFIDLKETHFDNVIRYISCASMLITVDTGPMHVGAALGVPTVVVSQSSAPEWHLSDQRDWSSVSNSDVTCLDCQLLICPYVASNPACRVVVPEQIARRINDRLVGANGNGVSAVIPVYRPEKERLNRCLDCILPQVDEVIITMEGGVYLPKGVITDPKIRQVKKPFDKIGYGRNANYGVRHSNHPWILLLNDDVFLAGDAVTKMLEAATSDTGMVGQLLRYPDGKIQHAGTERLPGGTYWYHIDHNQTTPRITSPVEMENVCMASALVRREAFYDAEGFDEDFYLYSDDNAFCLRLRHAGWKIMFTPIATGIHIEHESSKHVDNVEKVMEESKRLIIKKWGAYLRSNPHANLNITP